MLLSAVGETNRFVHKGAEIAVSLLSHSRCSRVLRKLWRIKKKDIPLGISENVRPDFQELLTGVCLSIWVRQGKDAAVEPLVKRLDKAFQDPAGVKRFGGLALGESTHLVDEIRPWRETDPPRGWWLMRDSAGVLTLPIWPDHVGSSGTRWGRFRLAGCGKLGEPVEDAWIFISPPGSDDGRA